MSEPDPPGPPDGDTPADEPGDRTVFPDWPMTAKDAAPLLSKDIG